MVKWGFNLRSSMIDRVNTTFNSQNKALFDAGGRAVYYAVQDDEETWWAELGGVAHRTKLYRWWASRGAQVIHPLADAIVGIERAVSPAMWQDFLTRRSNWATMARKDLASAIVRTKHGVGWEMILDNARCLRQTDAYASITKGAIGPDLMLFWSDAWSNPAPTQWDRLTDEGEAWVTKLGPIAPGNPFDDLATDLELVFGKPVIHDGCFVYDHGNGIRVESPKGGITPNVLEFGVSNKKTNRPQALANLFGYLRMQGVTLAMLHTPVDPALAYFWKTDNKTRVLWSSTEYPTAGHVHEYTLWPYLSERRVIQHQMQL